MKRNFYTILPIVRQVAGIAPALRQVAKRLIVSAYVHHLLSRERTDRLMAPIGTAELRQMLRDALREGRR